MTIKDGGSAFPCEQHELSDNSWNQTFDPGMTLRQYAAIKLHVLDSGCDWLDDMIRKSLRDEIAASWIPVLASQFYSTGNTLKDGSVGDLVAKVAYEFADSMLRAREVRS